MSFNLYSLPLYIFSLLMLILAFTAWKYKTAGGAKEFSLLALACALYSSAYGLEISSFDLERVLFWLKIEYIGIAAIPALYILFALAYTEKSDRLSNIVKILLFIIPLITVILFYTNPLHGLMYRDVVMDQQGLFPVISFVRGPWYWVQSGYTIMAILFSNILFLAMWFNANANHRRQIAIMLIGSLIPWFGLVFYLFSSLTWNLDFNPFFISLSSIIFAWGLFCCKLFDLVPIARTKLFEELPHGVLILDPALRIIDINDSARDILGLDCPVVGLKAAGVFSYWPKLARLLTVIDRRYHVELKKEDNGSMQWFRVDFLPLKGKNGIVTGQIVLLSDITDRIEAEEKLKKLATTDMLTGLWNRRFFIETMTKELKRAQRYKNELSLIMLDVDHFKTVNDSFGHQAGDCTLQHIGRLFLNRLRAVDTAARLGGDEIGIILPETNIEDARELAVALKEAVADNPVDFKNGGIPVTVSIGVAAFTKTMSGLEDVLSAADKALYQAKKEGRNRVAVSTASGSEEGLK